MTEYIHVAAEKRDFVIRAKVKLSDTTVMLVNADDVRITRNGDRRIARNGDVRVSHSLRNMNLRVVSAEKRNFVIRAKVNHG